MIIDNFDKIIPLLDFPDENTFYFLQIIQRKKDNPELGRNSNVIKCYYISSVEYLLKKKEEIIKLCDLFNGRASLNLNSRNRERVHIAMIVKLANQLNNRDFYGARTAYESVCGDVSHDTDKKWIIDIDTKNLVDVFFIKERIEELQTKINSDYKVLEVLPTVNGYHIISNPFNVKEFKDEFPEIEVHKNNPTLLYYKIKEND